MEQSRIEAKGSKIFKGIKCNILNKHQFDLEISNFQKNNIKKIVQAFRYVSYSELTGEKLSGKFNGYKKIIQHKLGKKYNRFFNKLKDNIANQENFANQLQTILVELGFCKDASNSNPKDQIDHENNSENEDSNNQDNQSKNKDSTMDADYDIEADSSKPQHAMSKDGEQEIGDDNSDN
ncbi:uncharacterized protein METZ01_LOCUS290969, partial [marine metagenome]